jgi:hypothetical protein
MVGVCVCCVVLCLFVAVWCGAGQRSRRAQWSEVSIMPWTVTVRYSVCVVDKVCCCCHSMGVSMVDNKLYASCMEGRWKVHRDDGIGAFNQLRG